MINKGTYGPLLMAEIGGNHEGDFEYAKRLTELAISSGVDVIKFQLYSGDTLVSKVESPERNQHFKKFELTKEQYVELAKMVTDAGLKYSASVWDEEYLTWIDNYISFYKIGSGDMTAYPVIKAIARLEKPIIMSTGLSHEKEVLDSIQFIQELNPLYRSPEMLGILQCTSMYPIRFSDANLKVIGRLKELTGLTVGYSDHTEGDTALKYAYAAGAEILEFHFTDSRENKKFRDHKVSLTVAEVKNLQQELKVIRELMGDPLKKPLPIEIDHGHVESFRRALYLNKDLKAGETISETDLIALRPNVGIDARQFMKVAGKRLIKDKKAFEQLNWDEITD